MLGMLTIFEIQTHQFNHEGQFHHNGRGTKGGGGPPMGGFNPLPTQGVQGVPDTNFKFLPISAYSSLLPISLNSQGSAPLFFSLPSRLRIPRGWPKMRDLLSCCAVFFGFLAFRKALQILLRFY